MRGILLTLAIITQSIRKLQLSRLSLAATSSDFSVRNTSTIWTGILHRIEHIVTHSSNIISRGEEMEEVKDALETKAAERPVVTNKSRDVHFHVPGHHVTRVLDEVVAEMCFRSIKKVFTPGDGRAGHVLQGHLPFATVSGDYDAGVGDVGSE